MKERKVKSKNVRRLLRDFRVPKEHPIFVKPEEVEKWIMDMELLHSEYTNTEMGNLDNPNFITKLVMYFDEEWGARSWFQIWATEKRSMNEALTWSGLKEALHKRYSGFDQPRLKFDWYIDMVQSFDVKRYIANKAEAALHCEGLSDQVKLYSFIRGLKKDIQSHVNLQRPKTLEDAQDSAIAFENSRALPRLPPSRSKTPREDAPSKPPGNDRKRHDREEPETNQNPKRPRYRTSTQQEALEEIRRLKDGTCWGCGKPGHSRHACISTPEEQNAFKERIDKLKEKVNQE